MLLSDGTIKELIEKGEIVIKPFNLDSLSPSSVDLRLGNRFIIFKKSEKETIDVRKPINRELYEEIETNEGLTVKPYQFLLAHTLEYIKLPSYVSARLEGRSSLARLGLIIHSTGGFIDAGFEGQITLEITNINSIPIKIYPGMRIAQIAFEKLDRPAGNPYNLRKNSKYVKQRGATLSKIYLDFGNK
ncbi:MAG: dCTP deaminase [Candidatus Njordarchaeia archaeon]